MPEPTPASDSSNYFYRRFASILKFSVDMSSDQSFPLWRDRLGRLTRPRILISSFLVLSALYCFVIGRDRFTSTSEFVIQQALPLDGSSASILSGASTAPSVLMSLLDGQYLQVYLESADVKNRLFPDPASFERDYAPEFPDLRVGLPANSSAPVQLDFYRKQLFVAPQPLTGTVILSTSGFTAEQAYSLNKNLLNEARRFVNDVNQSINADQNQFAKKEVSLAENNLNEATRNLEIFQEKNGNLSVVEEQSATSSFIAGLESQLVELKVEEAALRRTYRDPDAPEVSFLADQVKELQSQIRQERDRSVSENGRDLNTLALKEEELISDVEFARQALQAARLAVDNSRRESLRQFKFVVVLSQPQMPVNPDPNWRWQAFLASLGIVIVAWGVGGFVLNAVRKG